MIYLSTYPLVFMVHVGRYNTPFMDPIWVKMFHLISGFVRYAKLVQRAKHSSNLGLILS